MDLNQPLFWLGLMGGLVMLVRGARSWRADGKSWAVVGVMVLAVAGASYWVAEEHAGFIAFATWSLLVLGPNVVARRLQQAIDRQEHERAASLARWLARIHPSPSTRLVALDREVSARFQRGDGAGAEALLAGAGALGPFAAKWAAVERLRLAGRFGEIVAMVESSVDDADLRRVPSFVGVYLRALGETGRRADMFRAFARLAPLLEGEALARQRAVVWMIVLAFAGRRSAVERLLGGRLSGFTPALRSFWLATAALAASPDGEHEEAVAALASLARGSDALLARAAERRLTERAILGGEPLTPQQEADCAAILRSFDQEERFGLSGAGRPRPVVTSTLIAANVAVYGLEWALGDPTSDATLLRMGALYSPAVIDDKEWWRLVACLFLHFGAVHLVMNMLGLWVLGPFVEYSLGRARWLFVYLGAGLVGSVVLTVLPRLHLAEAEPCVGASGAIMGLVGATMAIALRGTLRERSRTAKSRLLALGLVVALQTVFDFEMKQVSFTAHASGLVAGFVLASLLAHRASSRLA